VWTILCVSDTSVWPPWNHGSAVIGSLVLNKVFGASECADEASYPPPAYPLTTRSWRDLSAGCFRHFGHFHDHAIRGGHAFGVLGTRITAGSSSAGMWMRPSLAETNNNEFMSSGREKVSIAAGTAAPLLCDAATDSQPASIPDLMWPREIERQLPRLCHDAEQALI
jgi:hypothetical protein